MKGFALIEILIALFIISLGLIGIVGMQLSALRYSEAAYQQSIAITQLAAMADRLRANHSPAVRDFELQRWNAINTRLLPGAAGSYYCSNDICKITLEWKYFKSYSASLSVEIAG